MTSTPCTKTLFIFFLFVYVVCIPALREVPCIGVETMQRYTDMQGRVSDATARGAAEVRRLFDAIVEAEMPRHEQVQSLGRHVEQLGRQQWLSRYKDEKLVEEVQAGCLERVNTELTRLLDFSLPSCGSPDELLAYCKRMRGVVVLLPLRDVLPGMRHDLEVIYDDYCTVMHVCLKCVVLEYGSIDVDAADVMRDHSAPQRLEGTQGRMEEEYCALRVRRVTPQGDVPVLPLRGVGEMHGALEVLHEMLRLVRGDSKVQAMVETVKRVLESYMTGEAKSYAGEVQAALGKSFCAVARVCESCHATGLREHVDVMSKALQRVKDLEDAAPAPEATRGADGMQEWQMKLQTSIVGTLETWLHMDCVDLGQLNDIVSHLQPLNVYTGEQLAELKKRCRDRYLQNFNIRDEDMVTAVKDLNAAMVRQRLDFLKNEKQGDVHYKMLRRRWADRVQERLDFRIGRKEMHDECARKIRKANDEVKEIILEFEDTDHFDKDMFDALCDFGSTSIEQLRDLLEPLLRRLSHNVSQATFSEAGRLLQDVDDAEHTLGSLLPEGVRRSIKETRDAHKEKLESLKQAYKDCDVMNRAAPELPRLRKVLDDLREAEGRVYVDVMDEIKDEVSAKVRTYLESQEMPEGAVDVRGLKHLQQHLPTDHFSAVLKDLEDLSTRLDQMREDAEKDCQMYIKNNAYENAVALCRESPNNRALRHQMTAAVADVSRRAVSSIEEGNVGDLVKNLNHLQCFDNLPETMPGSAPARERVCSQLSHCISRVQQELVTGRCGNSEKELRIVSAAVEERRVEKFLETHGGATEDLRNITEHLVSEQKQLDEELEGGNAEKVAHLLQSIEKHADLQRCLKRHAENPPAQFEDVCRKVSEHVQHQALPELDVCDGVKARGELIEAVQDRLKFAAKAAQAQLPGAADLLRHGQDKLGAFVQSLRTKASSARTSVCPDNTADVELYVNATAMLAALCAVDCVQEAAQNAVTEEERQLQKRVKDAVSTAGDASQANLTAQAVLRLEQLSDFPLCRKDAKMQQESILVKHRKIHSDETAPLADLYVCLKSDETGYGGKAIAAWKDLFQAEEITAFNAKVGVHDINYVLSKLPDWEKHRSALKKGYDEFDAVYQTTLANLLVSRQKKDNHSLKQDLRNCLREARSALQEQQAGWFSSFLTSGHRQVNNKWFRGLAHIFAVWSVQCCDPGSVGRVQKRPHPTQVLTVFRALTCVAEGNGMLAQILTGEGKSIVLGALSTALALQGFTVSCVCFSQYLSRRDYNGSRNLFEAFGVTEDVHYGTIDELCERVLAERTGDFRERVHGAVLDNKALSAVQCAQKKHILVVDEVDVFLSKAFRGATYTPTVQVRSGGFLRLADYVWKQHQGDSQRRPNQLQELLQTDEYKACHNAFGEWGVLVEEAARDLLHAAATYKDDTEWRVREEKVEYKHFDGYSSTIVKGYATLFHYYDAHARGELGREAVERHAALLLRCGFFSYAELAKPPQFAHVIGVSGTLPKEGSAERKALQEEFKLKEVVEMPSMFGLESTKRTNLKFNEYEDTVTAPSDSYMMGLHQQVAKWRGRDYQRAVLVFFETERHLQECYNHQQFAGMRKRITRLTEHDTVADKERKVGMATMPGNVTFCTRSFGRGTDFVCSSKKVLDAGGVHTLMTFVAPESEERQVKGRSGRQGEPGSFSFMLEEEALENVGMSAEDVKKAKAGVGASLYTAIKDARNKKYSSDWIVQKKTEGMLLTAHTESMAFLDAVQKGDTGKVKKQLRVWNKGKAVATKSATIVLIDRTGSMGHLLGCATGAMSTAQERTVKVLEEKQLNTVPEMLIGLYSNYNADPDLLLQSSGWHDMTTAGAAVLSRFMGDARTHGGWGDREAVEVGLNLVRKEVEKGHPVSQVIIIGDAAPNTDEEVVSKRLGLGRQWKNTQFAQPVTMTGEMQFLVNKGVKVHTYYLYNGGTVKKEFTSISQRTGGRAAYLDVSNPQTGADVLTEFLSKEVLRQVGGEELVGKYTEIFGTVCHV